MQCKYLKLTNGENIIALTDDACATFKDKEFINVSNPVVVNVIKFPRGNYIMETYMMEPWIRVAKDSEVKIPTKSIIIAVDVKEETAEYYNKFIEERKNKKEVLSIEDNSEIEEFVQDDEPHSEVEEFISNILSNQEDEEDDGPEYIRNGKVIH